MSRSTADDPIDAVSIMASITRSSAVSPSLRRTRPVTVRASAVDRKRKRVLLLLATVLLATVLVAGCVARSGEPGPASELGPSPVATDDAQGIADTSAEQCGPAARDRLYDDAQTRDPALAARWYADGIEREWQQVAEEACYLALVTADP